MRGPGLNCDNPPASPARPPSMSPPIVPTKTPLGQEELRRRTGGLGQRHRTILFLIDGRRPLSEVLSLALKAGAATSHFEDLVRLGYVELPPESPAEPAVPPEPPADVSVPAGVAEARITHLELEVPATAELPMPAPPEPPPVDEPEIVEPPAFAPTEPAEIDPDHIVLVEPLWAASPPAPPPPAPRPPPPPPPPPPARAPAAARRAPPPPAAPATPPPPAVPDEDLPALDQARACLIEAIRVDAQPAGSRIAERARQAKSVAEMIEVVWVMERGLSHSERSHRGLVQLQRARELLGLGNTLVDEDSRPSRLDD